MIKTLILALVLLAVVFCVGFAYWVNKDCRRRTRHVSVIGFATLLGLVPFVGPLLYLLFRPAETREEVRARNAELAALDKLLRGAQTACPECSAPVGADYLVCPVCVARLRVPCTHCDAALEPLWQVCPYCEAPVGAEVDLDVALTREVRSVPALDIVPDVQAAQAADV